MGLCLAEVQCFFVSVSSDGGTAEGCSAADESA